MIEKLGQAKQIYFAKKYDEAYSMFSEIIANEPNNYMAIIYRGFCLVYKTTLTEPHHVDMVAAIKQGFDTLRKQSEKPISYVSDCLEIINEVNKFILSSLKMYSDKFNFEYNEYVKNKKNTLDYEKYSGQQGNLEYVETKKEELETKYKKDQVDYVTGINLTGVAFNTSLEIILYDVMKTNVELFNLDNYTTMLSIIKSTFTRFKEARMSNQVLEKTLVLYNFCNDKVNRFQEGKKEEYWSSHKEEKVELETKIKQDKEEITKKEKEISDLEESKTRLTMDLSASPSYIHQQENIRKLTQVNDTLNKISAFDIKTKKKLTEEKTRLEKVIKGLGENVKREKIEIEEKFKSDKKAIEDKVNQLQNDIVNLKREISNNEKLLNQNR